MMCLLLIAYKSSPKYDLIIAANRDEFYNRPALHAKFWNDQPGLLAGKDLKAGGTWLGITKIGRIAAITNYRDPSKENNNAASRGTLVADFLLNNTIPDEYSSSLLKSSSAYNGYNLIFSDMKDFFYYSNISKSPMRLAEGVYGLSNHLLDTPWYKVKKSKSELNKLLKDDTVSIESLFKILADKSQAPDSELPDTGVGIDIERILSPIFISTRLYGTRSSTVILIDKTGNVSFTEKYLNTPDNEWHEVSYNFKLTKL